MNLAKRSVLVLTSVFCALAVGARAADLDLSSVLEKAQANGQPVLVLVHNPSRVSTLDAGYWVRNLSGSKSVPHQRAFIWNDTLGDRFQHLRGGGLFLLAGTGDLIAQIPIPPLREQLGRLVEKVLSDLTPLEELVARAQAEGSDEATRHRAWSRLVAARQPDRAVRLLARTENAALAQRLTREVDLPLREELLRLREALGDATDSGVAEGQSAMRRLLARPMDHVSTLRCSLLLAHAVCRWGEAGDRKRLERMFQHARSGRAVALAALYVGDARFEQGDEGEAKDWWKLAERAAEDGESPVLQRAARRRRATADGKDSTRRSRWYKREALDVVVLVSDIGSFAEAVSCWTEKRFFPVLFADRAYAPTFLNAYRPQWVVVVPPVTDANRLSEDGVRRAVLSGWLKDQEAKRLSAQVGRVELLSRLRSFGDDPQGVVFTQLGTAELPGALALAAGRFQGIEFLAQDMDAERIKLTPASVRELARHVEGGLQRWGLPRDDRSCAVTLAGGYPLCFEAIREGQVRTLAVDDWIGRAADGGRLAFTGRLINGRNASAYAAACSLFLQPDAGELVRTDAVPDKVPSVAVFTAPGAGRDPEDGGTLCGRALQAGLFWCAASVDGSPAESWPKAGAWKGWVRAHAFWGRVFRTDDGQAYQGPGRKVIFGDPLFSLRRDAAKRRELSGAGPVVRSGEQRFRSAGAGEDFSRDEWLARIAPGEETR